MIEEIPGPNTQSMLRLFYEEAGFSEEEVEGFLEQKDLLPFEPSDHLPGTWLSHWGEWLTLDHLLEHEVSPEILAYLLKVFAEVYVRHQGNKYPLLWDRAKIYYQMLEVDREYHLRLSDPRFIPSKVDLAEDFFQDLLETYLTSEDLSSEQAETWLLARDEEWPHLLEVILEQAIVDQKQDAIQEMEIRRVKINPKETFFPSVIPLACLTQVPPRSGRLSAQQVFWIEGTCILGSAPQRADYLLKSSMVLPEHCLITYEGNNYAIKTLDTGTVRVNGKKIGRNQRQVLPYSCVIEIADIKLYFFIEGATEQRVA